MPRLRTHTEANYSSTKTENKMLNRKLSVEERKERNHRLCPVWRLYGKHRAGAENHDGRGSARTSCTDIALT